MRGFAEHLLSYALGREITFADAPWIKEIAAAGRRQDDRFSALVTALVLSPPFRTVDNRENPAENREPAEENRETAMENRETATENRETTGAAP